MKRPLLLVLMPYLISVAVKVAGIFLDEPLMKDSLRDVVEKNPDSKGNHILTIDQQGVIVKHLAHRSLKTATVLTCFTSSFAFFAGLAEVGKPSGGAWAILLVFIFGLTLIVWVLPRPVGYFNEHTRIGLDKGTLAILLFCVYDLILALSDVATNENASSACHLLRLRQ